ncbi:hypothetical protein [Labrys wisconsinensis]|uniref:Uncharacterized protein n=1 Tax=Labrys wisconsinensis TaxID=425677 RepID=A0ABU0JEB0_9HYPH|nr:hypothetical protein [Labrys wisconsinensis]MDQ0472616.1 hypothetical protein [Labrys wisconsinensis]
MTLMWKGAVLALAMGLAAPGGALAAGPVHVLNAPAPVIKVKDGRNAAAAAGAVGGLAAGILLGNLMAQPAEAAPPAPVYVQPRDYGYEPAPPPPPRYVDRQPAYGYPPPGPGYDAPRELRRSVEICRRGILTAARRYGAFDARVGEPSRTRRLDDGSLRFRVPITVYYRQGQRNSLVACNTYRGSLVSAEAVR